MSNTRKLAVVALRLGLSGVILFVSAACAAVATPAPSNTPGMEVTDQVGPRASGTAMPTPATGPKATSEGTGEVKVQVSPRPDGTDIPTPATGPKATSEETGQIPAAANAPKDTSESIGRRDGAGEDDQALTIPDKRELKYPNLGSRLDGLVASVEAGQATAEEAAADTPVHSGESVGVTIHLSGSVDEVVAFLEENGGDPRNVGEDYVEAYVPVTLLGPASEQPGVLRIREIVPPERGQGG